MKQAPAHTDLIRHLQQEVLRMQGYNSACRDLRSRSRIGPFESAFPGQTFPTAAVHEFISPAPEAAAATNGFIAAILSRLLPAQSACLWISNRCNIYPPALKLFGIAPERVIFLDLHKPKEVLWAVEEALKCEALGGVIGEFPELSFTESRRLQLAVEKSRVTGFIHRYRPRTENTVACVSRWKVTPLPCHTEEGMPGITFPRWQVALEKVRNGRPANWQLEWTPQGFRQVLLPAQAIAAIEKRKTG